ncbi:DUF3376 domain-containing protein [Streptomyces griseoincarnatus]
MISVPAPVRTSVFPVYRRTEPSARTVQMSGTESPVTSGVPMMWGMDVRDQPLEPYVMSLPPAELAPEASEFRSTPLPEALKRATREFAEDHNEALVTAARATASYPVAFQPVSEHPLLTYRVHPDKELDVPASCVMDGGVLNNAPFTPVLDEITERRGGPAERVVMFVAPSGGMLADEAVKDRRCGEISRRTAAWSALNYPQEVDFRSGIEDVQFRLEISGPRSRDELLCRLLEGNLADESSMRDAAQALYAEYRRSRVLAVRKRLAVTNTRVTALKAADEPLEEIIRQVLAQQDLKWLPPTDPRSLFNEDWSVDLSARKLYGLRCYHFAAFLSQEWRCHDFAWGRLDAAHHLLSLLSGQPDGEETESRLHEAILRIENLPGQGDDPVERMRGRLKQLSDMTDDDVLADDLTAKSRRNMLRPLGLKKRLLARPLAWRYHWRLKWRSWRRARRARRQRRRPPTDGGGDPQTRRSGGVRSGH